ncbi:MAG: hypothetical protein M1834_000575 [Cirrosporium novae-zelandiae]|nr:MAG: hypothetical protein M1834_000575 [Cirrosporium novae-zelandiae]
MLKARHRFCFLPALITTILLIFFYNNVQDTSRRLQDQGESTQDDSILEIHWVKHPERNPVESFIPLPSEAPVELPKIQHDFGIEGPRTRAKREARLDVVKAVFDHAWKGYQAHAWMRDEVAPLTGGYFNTFGGWAATLVDTLDTLWIMGMHEEFENALEAIKDIDFTTTQAGTLNVFETTIRYLGGFLSAYDLTDGKYPILLQKATELGELLYSAFDTPNRMPVARWNWMGAAAGMAQVAQESTLSAEIGSLTLEFTRLSQITGDLKYFDAVQRITDHFEKGQDKTRLPGLWPVVIDAKSMIFNSDHFFTLGGMADSLYEYLPKEYMLLGGTIQQYRKMYEKAIEVVKKHIFFRPLNKDNKDILLSGTARINPANHVMLEAQGQHLACFTGGMVGIAAKIFNRSDELSTARKLVDGCIWAYESMPSGLMPETFYTVPCEHSMDQCVWDVDRWRSGINSQHMNYANGGSKAERIDRVIVEETLVPGFTSIGDRRYILRPEAIESVFIMYRITGDYTLQDKAWNMFESIVNATWTDIANAGINDVTSTNSTQINKMESFWLAETLKYFYLIFSEPEVISLDDYVFNTEAHPFKRPSVS